MPNLRYSELNFNSLSEERKDEIKKQAEDIRQNHNLTDIKFNLIDFLVNVENFEIKSQYIDDATTGLLFIDDNDYVTNSNSNRVIIINRKIDEDKEFIQKRRFISAHEYAHFVLHKRDSTQFARRDERTISNNCLTEELEAEYFAYCFLLPEASVKMLFNDKNVKPIVEKLKDNGLTISEIVANIFNVSINKANKRLDMLGLL